MDLNRKILSDITVYSKYARYLPEEQRRETWEELVTRNMEMHIQKYPHIEDQIRENYKLVYAKKVLPSMRSLQFGGRPIEVNPTRIYNCSFLHVDDYRAFSETMFLLLCGTGVGYSVQTHHIEKLPPIRKPVKKRRFLVGDSIEGWADAIKAIMKAYMLGGSLPIFDFSDIRPKGAQLITSGGKAPGPEPLKECLFHIQKILDRKQDGEQLKSIECHDILCYIADAVLAGGIRRSAMIAFFDLDDQDMLTSKFDDWYIHNPQRGRANNSVVLVRHKMKDRSDFARIMKAVEESKAGEPGIFWTNDAELGSNPCCEISLHTNQFCNLCEINADDIQGQEDFNARCRTASFIGTLQAGYTDFHYLREIWRKTTEKEALLGIGMTGIASGAILNIDMAQGSKEILIENERVAKLIGVNKAARTSTTKPGGTTSLVLGCSSGVHAWHNDYYIRRMRIGKNEPIYTYLKNNLPQLVEDEFFKPHIQAVISIPIKAPAGAILRTESPIDILERVKKVHKEWISTGHRKGANTHNVSCTISVKDEEWQTVTDWMWENRECYSGISLLPYDGGSYIQAPFEDCSKEKFEELTQYLADVNLSMILEHSDETNLSGELACAGGACQVDSLSSADSDEKQA